MILLQAEVNDELLGIKEFLGIESTDTPEATVHLFKPCILSFFFFFFLLQFSVKVIFWIVVNEYRYIYQPCEGKHATANNIK